MPPSIIQIDDKLISYDLFDQRFICDLSICHGACCVHGDSGAPLTEAEAQILQEEYLNFEPYLQPEGAEAVREQGVAVFDEDNDLVTPLIDGRECAYAYFDGQVCLCGIEKAFNEGKTAFHKPVSCHLYPIRVKRFGDLLGLNYHRWEICRSACEKGKKENMPVFRFLKQAIITNFGESFYLQMEDAYTQLVKQG